MAKANPGSADRKSVGWALAAATGASMSREEPRLHFGRLWRRRRKCSRSHHKSSGHPKLSRKREWGEGCDPWNRPATDVDLLPDQARRSAGAFGPGTTKWPNPLALRVS